VYIKGHGIPKGVSKTGGNCGVHVASASQQAVTSSSERIVLVVCNASYYTSLMDNEVTQPDFFVLVGP
jgi:hypothetical protein